MKNEIQAPATPTKENQEQTPMKHPHGDEGKIMNRPHYPIRMNIKHQVSLTK